MATVKGGKKFEKVLSDIAKQLRKPGTLRVGFLSNRTYPDGTKVAMIAAIQEYGAPRAGIPPRPFFRNMIAKNAKEWPRRVKVLLKHTDYNAEKTLMALGQTIRDDLQKSIIDTNTPALSPITLMIRKMKMKNPGMVVTKATLGEAARRLAAGESTAGVSTKPLIETAVLLNSVDFEVKT